MAISLVAVGQKWTATIANLVIAAVNAMGRPAITPTSVAGTGVSLSGSKVVVSAASSVSINGVFSSTYDAYAIEFDFTTSGSATIGAVLRLSGTDASTAYDIQRLTTVNATATATQALNATSWRISGTAMIGRHSGTVKLYNAAVAAQTTGTVVAGAAANPMTTSDASVFTAFVSHRTTTAYDGLTITPSTGNLTGWVRVYGIA